MHMILIVKQKIKHLSERN